MVSQRPIFGTLLFIGVVAALAIYAYNSGYLVGADIAFNEQVRS